MKNLTILTIFVTIFLVFAVKADDEMYSTKYDDMDVDAILASKRMRDGYIHCFLNTGNCTPAGAEVRSKIIIFLAHFFCCIIIRILRDKK